MRKKLFPFTVIFSCVFLFSLSVCADYNWPPAAPDMPTTIFTEDMMNKSLSGLKPSLQSMGDTGLQIQGVIISVIMVSSVFYGIVSNKLELLKGVRRREFNRKVNFLDRSRNLDGIVDDRVGEMEVQLLAKNRFRLKHPHADLDEKIYQRELSYQAELEIRKRHPERAMEEAIYRKEAGQKANREVALRKNESKLFEKRMKDK